MVKEDRMRRLLAYMWMASKTSCIPKPSRDNNTTTTVGQDPEFEAIIDDKEIGAGTAIGSAVSNAKQTASNSISPALQIPSIGAPCMTITTTQDLPGTGFRVNDKSTRWKVSTTYNGGNGEYAKPYTIIDYKPAVFHLTPCDVRRWQLAREAMDEYCLQKPNTNLDFLTIKSVPEFIGSNGDNGKSVATAYLGLSLVVAGYGGLHALAWNAHFPTHRERKLWRISALVIASPAALCLLFILLVYVILFAKNVFRFCYRKLATDFNLEPTQKSPPMRLVVKRKAFVADYSTFRENQRVDFARTWGSCSQRDLLSLCFCTLVSRLREL